MPFPQSFLDELMARSDIVDVVAADLKGCESLWSVSLPQ